MKRTFVSFIIIGALALVFLSSCAQRTQQSATTERLRPYTEVRKAVQGKSSEDVSKIVLEVVGVPMPIVVTQKDDIAALLCGMQNAVRTKERLCNAGGNITLFWKSGGKTFPYGFAYNDGSDYAFGEQFSRAYNRLVPKERRIRLN